MRILNFGSLNIDKVYRVEHFVEPGETILAKDYHTFCGGKGLNQSVALARAGADVWHAGAVGTDGDMLADLLKEAGVDVSQLLRLDQASGHAVIEVNEKGQNRIIVCQGTNGAVNKEYADRVLEQFDRGDILLLQNEISNLPYIMEKAHEIGMKIVLNPSPVNRELLTYPLNFVDCFILNEVEGRLLSAGESENPEVILDGLALKFPKAVFVLTLGESGCCYRDKDRTVFHPICKVKAVDTTAAGDTFCGYFLACISSGKTEEEALHYATAASAMVVSRHGAAPSIPLWQEVEEFEKTAVLAE